MNSFASILKERTVLFDGAMGSQLIAAGMHRGDCSEKWNLEHPDVVLRIQSAYCEAGADVLTTNTFGATRHHLEKQHLADHLAEINRTAVGIAREAGPNCSIAGDIGPTGLMFPPMGKADEKSISALVAEQAASLIESRVDLILIETQVDLREAIAALHAVRPLTSLPVGVTMTYNRTRRGYFTMVGDPVEKCCKKLADAGADFTGANCTLAPAEMIDLAGYLKKFSTVPVLIQPNAGQPRVEKGNVFYDISPEGFAAEIGKILKQSVQAVGGCCGTTPAFIREIRNKFPEYFAA